MSQVKTRRRSADSDPVAVDHLQAAASKLFKSHYSELLDQLTESAAIGPVLLSWTDSTAIAYARAMRMSTAAKFVVQDGGYLGCAEGMLHYMDGDHEEGITVCA